jgi:SAM-dependent methyltransferase
VELRWSLNRRARRARPAAVTFDDPPYKIHIGPGPQWTPPDPKWLTVDVDASRGDICANLNRDFARFPLADGSVVAIYASHVFEHVSIYCIGVVLRECYRVLAPGGVLRIVVPDPVRSMQEYLAGNRNFPLFARRIGRARTNYGEDYTLFEALREDFISRSGQPELADDQLAHQNAWDFEALRADLRRAGFRAEDVVRSGFRESAAPYFAFEGSYPAEANESDRSLYAEATRR